MHRCPSLPPSLPLYLSPSLDNRRCVHGRVLSPELTPQGISRFLCVDCWTSNKDKAGLSIGIDTRVQPRLKRPLWSVKGLQTPLSLSLSLERVHLQNDFPTSARCTRVTWLTHASPSLSAPYFALFVESLAFRIVCPSFLNARTRIPVRFGFFQLVFLFFFFIFDSDLPSTRDGIPFPVWIRNREWGCEWEREREQMGRIVSFKDRSLFLKRPIVRQSFPFSSRFLSSLFSFFMKFSIGKFPFRTFLYDSPKGRFHFFSIFSQDDANIVISLNLNIIWIFRINLIFNSLDPM